MLLLVATWNLNLQQQLGNSTTLQIAYVANRGIKLFSHRDINQSDPVASFNCYNNGGRQLSWLPAGYAPFVREFPLGLAMSLNWKIWESR